MSLQLRQSDYFWSDVTRRVDWYRDHASPEIAERFVDTVQETLRALTRSPTVGRLRFANHPELAGVRSWRVARPSRDRHSKPRVSADHSRRAAI